MIERKLVDVWSIGKYLLQGWLQISPVINGAAIMQRVTLIKGTGNEQL